MLVVPRLIGDHDQNHFAALFGSADPVADFDSNGAVNFLDLAQFKNMLFLPPGPSGIDNVCDP